jgi:lysophospholipase L1-like esterase
MRPISRSLRLNRLQAIISNYRTIPLAPAASVRRPCRSWRRFSQATALLVAFSTLCLGLCGHTAQAQLESKPDDPYFAKFEPVKAPGTPDLLLRRGDRLAICGDSITEQKMYSRMIETYLTVCVPELKISTRQYGWSGEVAEGFLRRMTNDCLRFKPTVATTCYGMNDHRYKPYDAETARWYGENQTAIVRAFKAASARVILGSPGCVGKMPAWVKTATGTVEDLNLNLCALRNLDIQIAAEEGAAFADVFWPMYTSGFFGQKKFGADFAIAGKDGVHPDWAGQTVMAYAFLKAMGLGGELADFKVDLRNGTATASAGHKIKSYRDNDLVIVSSRYPYCATGEVTRDNSIRAGMALVPFNQELNRFMLRIRGGSATAYKVTWGESSKTYSIGQLENGVNLAAEFPLNPFSAAFEKVDAAVAAKQAYETRQIKTLFHGDEGKLSMEETAAFTEKLRKRLAEAIPAAFKPVTHTIRIEPHA